MSLPHILLGFLTTPSTGYELKKAFAGTVRHFWNADLSQIYPVLHALERDRLVRSRSSLSPAGPQRRVYSRTAAGTRAFQVWLAQPPELAQARVPYLAQVFFLGQRGDWTPIRRHVEQVQGQLLQQLVELRALEAAMADGWAGFPDALTPVHAHAYFTFRAGLHNVQSRLAWCRETLAYVAGRADSATPSPTRRGKSPRRGPTDSRDPT